MKSTLIILLAGCLAGYAETEEQLNKRFSVEPGGKLIVDVDFGAIEVATNSAQEVTVDVVRKVSRSSKADEEAFLLDRPVIVEKDGNTVKVYSRAKSRVQNWWKGNQRNEGKYTITVPAGFSGQLKTAGGGISVNDLSGELKAETSGGGLRFARVHGKLDGTTSGGGVRVSDCEGAQKVRTSGGGIDVSGGSGSLDGETSGGGVSVKNFSGPARVESSGGGITVEDVNGRVVATTSGGPVSARFSSAITDEVKLETSGGGITLRVPESSAFDLDAVTSGGSVRSDLPVSVVGKAERSRLKGPVNGGGKPVTLRTSGGSIHVRKS